ncbi:MAG: HIRAN domain-containing protein [Gemmatimonadota bacterium]|nr:HIRAN domain-containing protein [Gemmatimonadota bacterium]
MKMSTPTVPPHDVHFGTPVYGTVFGRRMEVVHRLHQGDSLILVPDPPGTDNAFVWVHARGGDVVGHLPNTISYWLGPWMLEGGRTRASVRKLESDDVASWRRLIIEVQCLV